LIINHLSFRADTYIDIVALRAFLSAK